jgi:hypothetical protein
MRRRRWFGAAGAVSLSVFSAGLVPQARRRRWAISTSVRDRRAAFPARCAARSPSLDTWKAAASCSPRARRISELARLSGLSEELVAQKLDVIVVAGDKAAQVLKRATSSTPIVVCESWCPTADNRLPTIYEYAYLVREGGLISYGPDPEAMLVRAASFVDRIARGARPRDLAVEQPARYELFVNVATARALGLTIPQSLLLRASGTIP